jgi:DNA-binding IclR family transcriptional regulator
MPLSKTTSSKKVRVKAVRANGPKDRTQYLSRAAAKSVEILELLQEPMALNEVARQIKLSKTSAFRLLCTLESSGYPTQSGAGRYNLVPGIHRMANSRFLIRLLQTATPLMNDLGRALRETISLAVLFENRIEVIAIEESPEPIRMSNVVGHILPPNASSLGKAITAFQPPEQRERLLRSFGMYRFTKHTITDRKELSQEYEGVRQQKYAIDREECAYDGICFCAPIFGPNGQVSAAISSSMPKTRLRDSAHEEAIIAAVMGTADQIALNLRNA